MENQKNLFLAIIISMAIIFGFQLLVPQPERPPVTEENNAQNSVSLDIQGTTSAILLDRDQVLEETVRVTLDNSKIVVPEAHRGVTSQENGPHRRRRPRRRKATWRPPRGVTGREP